MGKTDQVQRVLLISAALIIEHGVEEWMQLRWIIMRCKLSTNNDDADNDPANSEEGSDNNDNNNDDNDDNHDDNTDDDLTDNDAAIGNGKDSSTPFHLGPQLDANSCPFAPGSHQLLEHVLALE